MGWLKDKIRNYLEIKDPQALSVNINQLANNDGKVFINKIWYRGNAGELEQLYAQLNDYAGNNHFWGKKPSAGMKNIRKIHTGLPSLIVDTLADISLDDLDKIEVKDRQAEWDAIAKENKIKKLLKNAVTKALWSGDGAFKWSIDPEISEYPIIEFYAADRVDYKYKRGILVKVIFKTKKTIDDKTFMLHEIYSKKGIDYRLFDSYGEEKDITKYPDILNDIYPIENKANFLMALPFKIYESETEECRGKSIFEGKIDNFDAFDEVWSQWMLAIRKGQIKTYIPDNLLPRDPNTGEILKNNDFDTDYIATGSDMTEGSINKIETTQGQIQSDALLSTYVTALDLCLQGLISPSTLGIDTKKLDNAEAQREKEKTTLYKRGQIIEVLEETIKEIVNITFKVYDNAKGIAPTETDGTPTFGGYANPSFEANVETVGKASTTNVMSVETQVEELWGDTKDDDWKSKEVLRIKQEKGIEVLEEPAVNKDIDLVENEKVLNSMTQLER